MKNETHDELQIAFDFFNKALFQSELPSCLITLNRKSKMAGCYVNKLWKHNEKELLSDEIMVNPDLFRSVPEVEVMGTLVHEMVHCWQAHFGKPSRKAYHNKEWSLKMQLVGLMPSSTGAPGGAKVGQKMADYPIGGGLFLQFFNDLKKSGYKINWSPVSLESSKEAKPKAKSKLKYSCPTCDLNVWGKPDLNISCGDCDESLEQEENED